MGSQFLNLKYCGMDHSIQSLKISNATGSTDVLFLFLIFFWKKISLRWGHNFILAFGYAKRQSRSFSDSQQNKPPPEYRLLSISRGVSGVISRTSPSPSRATKKKTQNSNEVYPQMGCDHCSQNIKLQLRYWTACDYWALWLVTNMCLVWLKTWFGSRHWSPWSDFSHAILSTATQKNSKFKWNLSADGLWSPALKTWNYNCVIGLLVNIELYGSYERTCVECTWVTAFAMEWFLARRQRLAVQLNENLKLSL